MTLIQLIKYVKWNIYEGYKQVIGQPKKSTQ